MPDGIEVVELSEIDLDFTVEEMFQEAAASTLDATRTDVATPDELGVLELFRGLGKEELVPIAARCQSIHAIPGYVLLSPGRLNTRIFFVLDGQLRLYAQTGDKRPSAIVDVGHSTGLRAALAMQPAEHTLLATEISHIVTVDVAVLDDLTKRLHTFARNYSALLASYVRGDNCMHVGTRSPGAPARQGYVDELTLLHNQHWLNTMFPRLVARHRLGDKPLAVTAFAIDKLDQIVKEQGIGAGLRILEAVGHWALEQTRPTDILALDKNRYLYAFLPESDLDAARRLAVRFQTLTQAASIALAPDQTQTPTAITLSLGVAVLEKGMKENEFLAKIEALIQRSIKLGGNRLSDAP
jgi:two-component system cell cycle response regulator